MLEDDFNDTLSKALRGLAMTAQKLGLTPAQLQPLLNGQMNPALIKDIAPQLGLDAERLIQLENYNPEITQPANLHTFVSPFGHLGVNAFVLETNQHFFIFDTGTDSTELLQFIAQQPEKKQHLFITHHHPDHIAGIEQFHSATLHPAGQHHGDTLSFDNYTIHCLDVAGHASPATAYLLKSDTLHAPICIVGDAIFAGSIGGCQRPTAYQTALANIKEKLLTLPAETILCTGHGPSTTVANERKHNPFF